MIRNVIFSSDRMGWVGREHPKGCVFCGIVKEDKRVPRMVLYRGEKFIVVMNIFPYNTGHLQVLPVRHIIGLEDLTDDEVSEMFILVKRSMKLLKKVLKPKGFNVGINQGAEVSGASIEHLHVHIVPRFSNDFGFIDIIGKTKVLPQSLDDTFKLLKKHARILKG
jgi:diadenosine tetraphosphate (Ap4A) HIT family hydrolase